MSSVFAISPLLAPQPAQAGPPDSGPLPTAATTAQPERAVQPAPEGRDTKASDDTGGNAGQSASQGSSTGSDSLAATQAAPPQARGTKGVADATAASVVDALASETAEANARAYAIAAQQSARAEALVDSISSAENPLEVVKRQMAELPDPLPTSPLLKQTSEPS